MCCFLMLWHKDFRPRETSCFHFQIIYLGLLFFLMPETPSFIPPPCSSLCQRPPVLPPPPPTHTHTQTAPQPLVEASVIRVKSGLTFSYVFICCGYIVGPDHVKSDLELSVKYIDASLAPSITLQCYVALTVQSC